MPEGEVMATRTLDNNVLALDNDNDDGEGGEASTAREEKEGEEAEEDECWWYKFGHRLGCIVKDKLRNKDDDKDDDDDWDAASSNKRHHRPLLLPIQSHPLSLELNFIMDYLIPLFILLTLL